ncbi:MAG TPA: D-alanyl-D-alanine carboxypeptidase/D-alanyl-D-alanine-endopeptidase, partial [Bacteroidota bacterium]|nr:D-alanyl-D-alanine carboxypeptidase/D-alanyl-D-alanine-endopeptidase [Bacteroidota bacterium]
MRRHSPAVRPRGLPSALVFLLIGLIAAGARTPSGPLTPGEFETWLRSVLSEPALSRAFVGIHIVRAEDGATIAAYNAGKLFHPASNMKLLTTAAALALLPGDFSFRTELFADARIEDSVLRGNLYVRGGGDPLADTLDIDSLAAIVGGAGIRRIEGDLVGDVSIFDTVGWGKGWMWDDEPDPDEAFISALTFNRNAVTVTVAPAGRAGEPLAVTLAPEPAYFAIDNLSVTGGRR